MNYDIIATLGPASAAPADALRLSQSGANRFRINTSHLDVEETVTWVEQLRFTCDKTESVSGAPEVVLDLQGSKWRLGVCEPQVLAEGATVALWDCSVAALPGATTATPTDLARATGSAVHWLPVPHNDFFRAAEHCRGTVRLNDGRVELQIERSDAGALYCHVVTSGEIGARKGLSLPGCEFRREGLSDKDQEIVRRTSQIPHVSYALSYLRDAYELRLLKRETAGFGRIIAKIERPEAVRDIAAIDEECDEVWICRGDLGAEVGLAAMAATVHELTQHLGSLKRPTVLAGQVLEHMTTHPEPTRSEVCHLYDALTAGYSGIVLSDETAIGTHPAAACRAAAMFRS